MRLVDLDIEIPMLQKEAELKRSYGDHIAADVILYVISLLENNSTIAFDYDGVYKKIEHKMWNNASSYNSYAAGKFYAYEDSLETVKDGVENDN